MPKIQIKGIECLNKVAMTKAINSNFSYNLKESKSYTDSLLSDGFVEIDLSESINVIKLLSDLKAANANVKFIE